MRRWGALLLLVLLVPGCFGPSERAGRRLRRPAEPPIAACLADLSAAGARYERLPDRDFAPGCSARRAVKLVAIGIPITNLGAMTCQLATPFTRWVQEAVQPAAQRHLGSSVVKIESMGSYACRPVNGMAGNDLSEHATANAVDIAAFRLADGRRITVAAGWNGTDPRARTFLRALHTAACRRFSLVLGPDANARHQDHFHFDMGPGPYCR